jgi:Glycosyltransferase family 87
MINNFYQRIKNGLLKLSLLTWVLVGFFVTFFFFFIQPVFFDPSHNMQFNQYIAVLSPIGRDFRGIVYLSSTWLHTRTVPLVIYPPFTLIFFTPFTLLNYGAGYKIITCIILVCYVLTTLILPFWMSAQKSISALAMLIFVTGMVSYGLQFEVERGQWNLIAFTFCLIAIYIFHHYPRRRWLAYLFFTISVQLKLFPAIFVFALIEDWSGWKDNLKRFVGLGIVNIAALFIFGLDPIWHTLGAYVNLHGDTFGPPNNISISSFAAYFLSSGLMPHQSFFLWLEANDWVLQFLVSAFFVLCFVIILRQAYKRNGNGFDPWVFMACVVGALIIPSISFDYKLSILPASVALSIPAILERQDGRNRSLVSLLVFVLSMVYSSTLYSYRVKPEIIRNDLPALLVILAIYTILSCVNSGGTVESLSNSPEVEYDDQ